jgi:iron complex transport system substrate-binding protein
MTDELRVVSLLPGATEIVCALGLEGLLVGRSHECDYPVSIVSLPACTEARLDDSVSSAAIDEQVSAARAAGRALYGVQTELLEELAPDVIITQAQCDVCAVSLNEVEEAVAEWPGKQPRIISLAPSRLDHLWGDLELVADALGHREAGTRLQTELQARIDTVVARVPRAAVPKVACIEWTEPLMAAGNWVPELVELAGGVNLFGIPGKPSLRLAWSELQDADPDLIVVHPCGYDLTRTRREVAVLAEHEQWPALRAVQADRVALVDGNQYFNRPGPRLVDSLEILSEVLHPEVADFGYRGTAWVTL